MRIMITPLVSLSSSYNKLVLIGTQFVNWAICIRHLMLNLAMHDLWDNQWLFVFNKSFLNVAKQCFYDHAKQDLHRILGDSSNYSLI